MRIDPSVEEYRLREGRYSSRPFEPFGAFELPGPCGDRLTVIASDSGDPIAEGWEHVSVSTRRRIPNWIEMSFVKDRFWTAEDCVVQFHPPKPDYINNYGVVLHMWKWCGGEFPRPPSILVGYKELGESGPRK